LYDKLRQFADKLGWISKTGCNKTRRCQTKTVGICMTVGLEQVVTMPEGVVGGGSNVDVKMIVVGGIMTAILALAAGFAAGPLAGAAVVLLFLFLLLIRFMDCCVFIRVGEMETAVVFNRETKAFSRFLLPGRHLLKVPVEHVKAVVSTSPNTVKGRCKNVQSREGIGVQVEVSMTYQPSPADVEPMLRPKAARIWPKGTGGMARTHLQDCAALLVNRYTVADLYRNGARSRIERELRDACQERLKPFGLNVFRVIVIRVDLPTSVEISLEQAHERAVQAEALERMGRIVAQFSDVEMERVFRLEQLRQLGQNGVAVQIPHFGGWGYRGNDGDGRPVNGRSGGDLPFNPRNGRSTGRPYAS
jgi:regulator of protease activity HflC (stomatin/prohibitin superfamily)